MARGRREFEFKPSYDETIDRVERKGALFDNIVKDVKLFKAKADKINLIRIMPPTWPKPKHYGLYVKVHNNIGPKNRRYLCLKDVNSPYDRCPICDELYKLGSKATDEDRKMLRTSDSVLYYLLDKDEEKEGLQVWITSANNDSEIAAHCLNRRSKSILDITDPDNGYDVEFTRTGTTFTNTRYRGFNVVHEPSPISDNSRVMDTALDEIFDRPLNNVLNFYSPKYIEEVFYGYAQSEDDGENSKPAAVRDVVEESQPVRRTTRTQVIEEEVEEERPRRTQLSRDLDDEIPQQREERPTTRPRLVEEEPEQDRPRSSRVRDVKPEEDEDDEQEQNERARARLRDRLRREE